MIGTRTAGHLEAFRFSSFFRVALRRLCQATFFLLFNQFFPSFAGGQTLDARNECGVTVCIVA
jgi:hypothetical protein